MKDNQTYSLMDVSSNKEIKQAAQKAKKEMRIRSDRTEELKKQSLASKVFPQHLIPK